MQGALFCVSSHVTAIIQVVESTGLVMTPYIEFPQLLGVLLRMLNEGEGSQHVRREVLKVGLPSVAPPPTLPSVGYL
jgi:hypothetical protein